MTTIARCSCGTHTLALPGPPPRVTLCFCRPCQKRTGGPYSVNAYYPAEGLRLPDLPAHRRTADSGRWLDDHFCPTCAAILFYRFEWKPQVVGVPVGMIDGWEGAAPDRAVFLCNQPPWVVLPEGIERFERGSDGPLAAP